MIELHRLRHAIAIVEHGTFGAAARSLHMSQSALTRSIQALETEYGVRLFERGRAGARLTDEGSRFIALAERLVQHAGSVERDLHELGAGAGVAVEVGMGPISATLFLPTLLEQLLSLTTQFPVRVKIGSNSELRDMLQAGLLDFYVGGVPRESPVAVPHGLRAEPLGGRSRLALLAREGHALLESPGDLGLRARFPVVAGSFARDTAVGADVALHGFAAPALVIDDYEMLALLVRRTDALLLATELLLVQRPELGLHRVAIDLAAHAEANYALVFSDARRPTASSKQVAAVVRRAVAAALERRGPSVQAPAEPLRQAP